MLLVFNFITSLPEFSVVLASLRFHPGLKVWGLISLSLCGFLPDRQTDRQIDGRTNTQADEYVDITE